MKNKAIVVVGLALEPNVTLPEFIGTYKVHSVLSCEEARFPELDVRLLVFTAVAPYSQSFKAKKDVFFFLSEIKGQHPSCELWLCSEHDIAPGDPCLNAPEVSSVVRILELRNRLDSWIDSGGGN